MIYLEVNTSLHPLLQIIWDLKPRICCQQPALASHDSTLTIQNENNDYIKEPSEVAEVNAKFYYFKFSSLTYHTHYYSSTTEKLATQVNYLHIIASSVLGCGSTEIFLSIGQNQL